jgi:hypothetical protein
MPAADYVFWAAVIFVIGCNLYFGPRIKADQIAMQWGLDGKPTWYAPKRIVLRGMVAFLLAIRLLIWVCMTYTPALVHGADIGIIASSVIVAASHLFILMKAVRAT